MKRNIGDIDRSTRLIAGLLLAGLYFGGIIPGITGIVLLILGVVLFLTALAGTCPLYSLLGISTCSLGRKVKP